MAMFYPMFFVVKVVLVLCMVVEVHSRGPVYTPPDTERVTDGFVTLKVSQSCNVFFGGSNVRVSSDGTSADLSLDRSSGSGLVSKNRYYYGFFNAALKLPAGFTSGVVVAYYTFNRARNGILFQLSNADAFPHNHDEIDIELLGHEKRREWVLQTNIYGNGSVSTGREEKFYLWFDPTQGFHNYSILWNSHHVVFMVDDVPVREVVRNTPISSIYPSKPMSAYTTIWDASQWATHGGKYPVNYKYAPFLASVGGVEMEGCVKNRNDTSPSCSRSSISSIDPIDGVQFSKLSRQQRIGLEWARGKHMFYSYCQDKQRYKVMPPECNSE